MSEAGIREAVSFCRICGGGCGVRLKIACDRDIEDINAMPRMSAIPVNLERVNAAVELSN